MTENTVSFIFRGVEFRALRYRLFRRGYWVLGLVSIRRKLPRVLRKVWRRLLLQSWAS